MADQQEQQNKAAPAPADAAEPAEKKDDRKEAKKKKQEERAKKQQEAAAAKKVAADAAAVEEPRVVVNVTFEEVQQGSKAYGSYPLVQSTLNLPATKSVTGFDFAQICNVNKELVDKEVCIRARAHNTRGKGKSAFIVLRQGYYTVQAALFASDVISPDFTKWVSKIPRETVVEVVGKVVAADVKSCTQKEVELHLTKCYIVAEAEALPFTIEDALKTEENEVGQEIRLDNRVIDMRAPAHLAIWRIQSAIQMFFRQYLYTKSFSEIHTPKLIATASEGGAGVFKVNYFNRAAFLAQSPQLYKQMAVEGDLMRVFEIAPVFRAENSHTHRHLTEFMGLDIEMEIKHHYHEVLDVLDELFVFIFDNIQEKFATELQIISQQYPFSPIVYNKQKNLRLKYPEAVAMLREAGAKIGDFDDLSTPDEKLLGKLVKAKYNTDFYVLERYPANARPFYTMPCPDDNNYSNSYDLFIRGEEIASGAQRIHSSQLLLQVAAQKNVDLKPIQAYVDCFKYGAWPHGGAGIGLERVTMLYLGISNVRKVSMFPRDPNRVTP